MIPPDLMTAFEEMKDEPVMELTSITKYLTGAGTIAVATQFPSMVAELVTSGVPPNVAAITVAVVLVAGGAYSLIGLHTQTAPKDAQVMEDCLKR